MFALVPCVVEEGMFADERLVRIDCVDGPPVSFFANKKFLHKFGIKLPVIQEDSTRFVVKIPHSGESPEIRYAVILKSEVLRKFKDNKKGGDA